MKTEDGAYYAIKGFLYQFDYTILKILNQTDENEFVKIEQEQDLEYENYVVQIKHHETKYTSSKQKELVGKPTIKLLKEFENNQTKKYCLYIHLEGKTSERISLKTEELENFIIKYAKSTDIFNSKLKQNFINNFIIDYSKDFITQYNEVCQKITDIFNCDENVAKINYHGLIRNYLLKILTDNPKEKAEKRQTTLSELKEFANKSNSIIIHSEYSKILNEKKYLNYLKTQIREINYTYNNYIFFGNNIKGKSAYPFSHLIQKITDKYFTNKNLSKAKPFTIVIDKQPNEIFEIKKQLIKLNIKFNDGYEGYGEFSEQVFKEQPLIKTSKPKISSFSVKLISFETFQNIKNINLPDMIYIFGNNFNSEKLFDNPRAYFSVDNIEIDQIFELFKIKE